MYLLILIYNQYYFHKYVVMYSFTKLLSALFNKVIKIRPNTNTIIDVTIKKIIILLFFNLSNCIT